MLVTAFGHFIEMHMYSINVLILKPDSGAVCLAAYRAKPVVPVLRVRCFECVHVYIVIVC